MSCDFSFVVLKEVSAVPQDDEWRVPYTFKSRFKSRIIVVGLCGLISSYLLTQILSFIRTHPVIIKKNI